MSDQIYLKNVTSLKLDTEKCIGCGLCSVVCPHNVFEIKEAKAIIRNKDACMECGACMQNCPVEAINVNTGVGCAAGVINGWIRGTEPTCDCGSQKDKPDCC